MDHAEVLALRELLAADTWIALDKITSIDDGTLFDVFSTLLVNGYEDSSTVMRMPWGRNQPAIVFVIASLSRPAPIISDLVLREESLALFKSFFFFLRVSIPERQHAGHLHFAAGVVLH